MSRIPASLLMFGLAVGLLLSAGCSDEKESTETTDYEALEQEVGSEGALLILPGGASLIVPEGSLDETVLITAEMIDPPDIPDAEPAGPFYRIGPSGLSLSQSAEIRFYLFWYTEYADPEKTGKLRIATSQDDSNEWTLLDTDVHSDAMIVSARVDHF